MRFTLLSEGCIAYWPAVPKKSWSTIIDRDDQNCDHQNCDNWSRDHDHDPHNYHHYHNNHHLLHHHQNLVSRAVPSRIRMKQWEQEWSCTCAKVCCWFFHIGKVLFCKSAVQWDKMQDPLKPAHLRPPGCNRFCETDTIPTNVKMLKRSTLDVFALYRGAGRWRPAHKDQVELVVS